MATAGRPIELRSLPAFKAPDAYGFPLIWHHAAVTGTIDRPRPGRRPQQHRPLARARSPGRAGGPPRLERGDRDDLRRALHHDCGGSAEAAALPASGFDPGDALRRRPGRTISVYLPTP